MTGYVPPRELRLLLVGFLRREAGAREELPRRMHGPLVHLAARLAPDLAGAELCEDAVQRLWELLLGRGLAGFDPYRGTAMAYLSWVLRRAIRDVRAAYMQPGMPTRPSARAGAGGREPLKLWGVGGRFRMGEDGRMVRVFELVVDPADAIGDAEERVDATLLLRLAKRTARLEVLQALTMVYVLEAPLAEAARALGVKRPTLRRWINEWAARHDLELAG